MNPQAPEKSDDDVMRPEYDFSQGVRGKHYQAYRAGTNVVFLEADLAAVFPDSASVNQALRLLVKLAQTKVLVGGRSCKPEANSKFRWLRAPNQLFPLAIDRFCGRGPRFHSVSKT